jgi:hypothetical protein
VWHRAGNVTRTCGREGQGFTVNQFLVETPYRVVLGLKFFFGALQYACA